MERRDRWEVVAGVALVAAVNQTVWLTFAPVTTPASAHYGVSVEAIGWLSQPFVLLYVVLAIPAGLLLDRRFSTGLMTGAVLTAIGAVVRVLGDSYPWLLAGALIAAVGQPFVLNAMTGTAAAYLREEKRPAGIAAMSAAAFGGMLLAFGLGVAFSQSDEMPTLVAVQAGLGVVALVFMAVALRGPAPYPPAHTARGMGAFRAAWGNRLIRLLCLFAVVPSGVFIALTTWSEALLEPAGVTSEQVGIILIVTVLAGVIGSAVLPVWAARRRYEMRLAAVALVTVMLACLVIALFPGFVTALVSMAAIGFLALAMLPVLLELTEREAEDAEGTAGGLIWMSTNVGGLIMASIIGFTVGMPALSYLILAVGTVSAWAVLVRLRAPVAALPPIPGSAPAAAG